MVKMHEETSDSLIRGKIDCVTNIERDTLHGKKKKKLLNAVYISNQSNYSH